METSSPIDFSLVVPCYRESSHLEVSIAKVAAVLNFTRISWEIVFVDDCSPDQTPELIRTIAKNLPNSQILLKPVNEGRGKAVQDGATLARGTIVGFIDIDLEVAPTYMPAMIQAILEDGFDVATGMRVIKFDKSPYFILRQFLSLGYRWLFRTFTHLPIHDPETGYKFFRKTSLMRVLAHAKNPGWFWDTEVMSFSQLCGLKIKEIPCLFIRRRDKKSTIRVAGYTVRQFREFVSFARKLPSLRKEVQLQY